jgi:RHS repeat-associated protein
VLEESTSGSTDHYIREPGGSLLARLHPTDGIRYYHFDELGSTRLLTNPNGDITDRYTYDAYGSLLSHDAYAGSVQQPYGYVGQLGYYTHYMEPDFGLLQLGVRFYDAEVGRFTQRDPVYYQDDTSSYAYAAVNPLRYIDAWGEAISSVDGSIESCLKLPTPLQKYRCLKTLYETICDACGKSESAKVEKALANVYIKLRARDALAERCKGSVAREFPKELLEETVEQIDKIAKGAGELAKKAKTALKLLNKCEYRKCRW